MGEILCANRYLRFTAVCLLSICCCGTRSVDAAQFTMIDEVITIKSSNNGFYFWYDTKKGPANWTSPDDYYRGQIYCRFKVLEQPTNTPFSFSFCFWGKARPGQPSGNLTEHASYERAFLGGAGSEATFHSSPKSYWTHPNGSVDFTDENNFIRWGLPTWVENGKVLLAPTGWSSDPKSPAYWAHKQDWFPMKVHVQVVAVSKGSTFTGFPVPEPSTFALLATGLMGALVYVWRKRR